MTVSLDILPVQSLVPAAGLTLKSYSSLPPTVALSNLAHRRLSHGLLPDVLIAERSEQGQSGYKIRSMVTQRRHKRHGVALESRKHLHQSFEWSALLQSMLAVGARSNGGSDEAGRALAHVCLRTWRSQNWEDKRRCLYVPMARPHSSPIRSLV